MLKVIFFTVGKDWDYLITFKALDYKSEGGEVTDNIWLNKKLK